MFLDRYWIKFLKITHLNALWFRLINLRKPIIVDCSDKSAGEAIKDIQKTYPSYKRKPLDIIASHENSFSPKFDVHFIVPCYNSAQYLEECINSILKVKHSFFLSLIDDGSTDNTWEILQKFALLYPGKIEILQQSNKGAAAARNSALNHIRGKYLFFVDSDDYIDSNGVDEMIDVALKSHYDIVQGGFLKKSPPSRYKTSTIRTGTLQRNDLLGFSCGKLINSILFLNYQFPTGYAFEDTLMGDIIYPQAKKIYGLNTICYVYRIHKQQITKQYHKQLKIDALDQIFLPIEFNKVRLSLGFVNDNLYFERALRMGYLNYSRLICFDNKTKQNAFCIYANFLRTNFSKGAFQTKDKKLNILYKACEAGNYSMYKSAIKYL